MDQFDLVDPEWLSGILDDSPWDHGRPIAAVVKRVGEDYGLSGAVFRVVVTTDRGSASVIAKLEERRKTLAAWNAWECAANELGTSVPHHYGLDIEGDVGVILMEDVVPATQGDDLVGCTRQQALEVLDILVHLHQNSRLGALGATNNEPRWRVRIADREKWAASLNRAADRYPDIVTVERVARLRTFPAEIEAQGLASPSGNLTWVHVDPHLDNVLWRVDGSPVLIDWSNARIGPPEVDVAAMMMGYAFRTHAPISPDELIQIYADRTARSVDLVTHAVVHALKPAYIQGSMGWVGEESNAGFPARKERLRDETALRLVRALDWVDRTADV